MTSTNTEGNTKSRKGSNAVEASQKPDSVNKSDIDTEIVLRRNVFMQEGKVLKGTKLKVSFGAAREWVKIGIAEFT